MKLPQHAYRHSVVVLNSIVLCGVVWYGVMWCGMVYGVMWYMVWCGMLWYDVLYGMVWYGVMWYCVVWYMVWYSIMWCGVWCGMVCYGMMCCSVMWYGVMLNAVVWYGMAWYGMMCYMAGCGIVWFVVLWYDMEWCGMVWCGMVWYGMVWYGMAWHGMVWYGMVWFSWPNITAAWQSGIPQLSIIHCHPSVAASHQTSHLHKHSRQTVRNLININLQAASQVMCESRRIVGDINTRGHWQAVSHWSSCGLGAEWWQHTGLPDCCQDTSLSLCAPLIIISTPFFSPNISYTSLVRVLLSSKLWGQFFLSTSVKYYPTLIMNTWLQ